MEGYTDMCDACAAQKFCDDLDAKCCKELVTYNHRTGSNLTLEEFFSACDAEEVNRTALMRLPELRDIWDRAEGIRKELEQGNEPRQLTIEDLINGDDLPF